MMSLKIFDAYKNPSFHILSNFIRATQLQPPLAGIVTAPFYFIFGSAQITGIMLNAAVFLAVLIYSTYKLGAKLSGRETGALAAFLVTIYPVFFNQLKVYMLDVPLAAFAALSVYLLVMSNNFQNLKYSVLFGISCGLGMLVKDSFILFIIGPLSYVIIKNIFPLNKTAGAYYSGKWVINLILSLTLGFFAAFPYYVEKIHIILTKASFRWTVTWPIHVPEAGWFLRILRSFFVEFMGINKLAGLFLLFLIFYHWSLFLF